MDTNEILKLFRESGALLEGHFRLSSGLHSGGYLQCALVLQHPRHAEALGRGIAGRVRGLDPQAVLSPALGGIVIGQEVGRALGVRALFAERQDGTLTLRRGFTLAPGERVLVVEDVVTTAGSTRETVGVARAAGATVVGAASIIDRGAEPNRLDVPFEPLVHHPLPTWDAAVCPLCQQGVPIVKRGSRLKRPDDPCTPDLKVGPTPSGSVMRTLKLTIQYDGTDYVGWQRQPNGVSIQELVERAIEPIEGRPVTVIGAGRTDAGVHALGQVASVQLQSAIDPATLTRALNATLPEDVRVASAEEAAPDFNARFSATGKVYAYRIWRGAFLPPFERRYVWHVPPPLDVERMREAARTLTGRHDFSAFRAAGSDVATSERTIRDLSIDTEGEHVTLTVAGDGFLRYMVRAMAGTLVDVGQGRRSVESVAAALASRDRAQAGPTAPAKGLVLLKVEY